MKISECRLIAMFLRVKLQSVHRAMFHPKRYIALRCIALWGAMIVGLNPTMAQEPRQEAGLVSWGLEEARLGVLKQNLEGSGQESGLTLNGELLFASLFPRYDNVLARVFLSGSRPHIGASINTAGHTSQLYFGSTWTWPVAGPVFLEASFGGAVHDGPLRPHYDLDPKFVATYGCALNFRESASAGVDVSAKWRILLTVDHMSNAGICEFNRGLTNVGARMSYRFN